MASDTTKKKKNSEEKEVKTTKKTTSTNSKKGTTAKKSTATTKKTTSTKPKTTSTSNTKKTSTSKPKTSSTKASSAKKSTKSTTTKKTSTNTTAAKKSNTKTGSTKKTNTKTTSTKTTTAKKKAPAKDKQELIEIQDLETREADLTKTVILNPEIIQELHNEEFEVPDIDNIKIEEVETKKTKKEIVARTILGIDLPASKTKEDKKGRMKMYARDALIFGIIIPILDLFAILFLDKYTHIVITNNVPVDIFITLFIDFILVFIVTFLLDFVFGEDAVKRINQ